VTFTFFHLRLLKVTDQEKNILNEVIHITREINGLHTKNAPQKAFSRLLQLLFRLAVVNTLWIVDSRHASCVNEMHYLDSVTKTEYVHSCMFFVFLCVHSYAAFICHSSV
jgi:hypothetical protein